MTSPAAAARLVSNSRWNLIAFVAALLANFLSLPLAIAAIGLDAFGAAGLVLAVYAPFALVGTVAGQAIVRELAPKIAANDRPGCARVMWSAIALTGLGCALVSLTMAIVGPYILARVSVGAAENRSWALPLLICGAGWIAQQACLILQAALAATQQYGRLALVSAIGAVASAACVVVASRALHTDIGFLAGTALGFAILFVLLAMAVRAQVPWLLRPTIFAIKDLRELLAFARWQGAGHFSGAVANQVDRYVLGAVAPLAVVGQYNVAMRLQEVVHMGALKVTEVMYPHFSVTATDSLGKRCAFFVRASWLINMVGVVALAPLIPLAGPLIALWVDARTAVGGAPMLHTLATAGVIGSGVNVFTFFAMATDQAQRLAVLNISHSILLIGLTIPLIVLLGPLAAGFGYVIGNLFRLIAVAWLSAKYFSAEIRPAHLLCSTLPPLLGGLAAAWGIQLSGLAPVQTWAGLGLQYTVVVFVVFGAAMLATASSHIGRKLIHETWRAGSRLLPGRHGG